MSTQTGECQIDSIEGTTIKGTFTSLHNKNVGKGSVTWAAMFLWDAFKQAGQTRNEAALEKAIKSVTFTKPGQESTHFTIELHDAKAAEGLTDGYWDSYYVG